MSVDAVDRPPFVIALIGVDGVGKSSQIRALRTHLEFGGRTVVELPNASLQDLWMKLGEVAGAVRDIEQHFGIDAIQLVASSIKWLGLRGALQTVPPGSVVLADRYSYCHLALASRASPSIMAAISHMYAELPVPDICIWLDVRPETAIGRLHGRGDNSRTLDFIRTHRQGYEELAKSNNFVKIDAERREHEITADILGIVAARRGDLLMGPVPSLPPAQHPDGE